MASISPPGVEVIQEFVSTAPPVIQPTLITVLVGPAFQVISAFDDNGNPQDEAFAGTYRDGQGTIAYDLPSLVAEASLVGFEDDVRVFLVHGAVTRELSSVDDEEVIVDNGTGDYTDSTKVFEDLTQLFLQVGVEAGDVVRLTWRDELLDIPIVSVDSDTALTLDTSILDENLVAVGYDIVRNPAEFVFDATQQANAEVGDDADYLRFTCQTLKTDAITPADYVGAAGDTLSLVITDSVHYLEGTLGGIGDSVFEDTGGGNFLTSVGVRGAVTGTPFYAQVGASGSGQVLREVLAVVNGDILIIETGEGALGTQDWVVGDETDTGTAGATDGPGTTFTGDVGELFLTSIPNTAGTPDQTTLIEIGTDGVYAISAVLTDTTLTIAAATGALAGQVYTVIKATAEGTGDGETKADTVFVQADAATDLTDLANDATESLNIGGTEAATLTVVDADEITLGASLTDGGLLAWSAVKTTAALTLSFDPDAEEIIIQLERALGLSSSTYAEIEDAVVTLANPAYNSVVTDIVTAALGGTTGTGLVAITEADIPINVDFDGGADEEQLILDGDLLGSSTPTSSVYVSYKALRIDLSDQSANAALWEIASQDQRESILGPATIDNPLSLACSQALINSPTRAIKALGVSAVSASKPFGTPAAYSLAFDFLSSEEVHLILPLTQDSSVHQALQAHVDALSASDQKSERIGFFNTTMPLYTNATVVGSGSQGNTGASFLGSATAEFSASVDFAAAGAVAGDILVVTALSAQSSELDAVNGTVGPLYGLPITSVKVGDDFVLVIDTTTLTDTAWNSLVDVSWALYRAGAAIAQASDQAEVIAQVGEGYADRRMFHHWPDLQTMDVDGTEQLLPGFYLAASWAGKANEVSPETGFSRTQVSGHLSLRNSNTYFSKSQLDRMAGGGTWISIQESQNAPLKCRHQLSTDTSSIEKQEFSITRAVDYTAKYLRQGLDRQVGKFNITQSYLDGLATTVAGLLRSLVEAGKLRSASLVSIAVDDVRPDKINVIIAIGVLFPANLIEVTLQI